ncbi:hypothetical protein CU044_0969 [Streptomyces sp. L-9-10]|uniref:DUF5825 family protein n=1 Tax=Streptomyces sp. L-9-10 TaxID=1478131 RepID=UPI00101C1028|nr:DUF5825 family protein [Streptomyces sp. L-9-10]RYJ30626.1 hypothetical protein CU044_0969 [Streptomyces sp. L-9-10]
MSSGSSSTLTPSAAAWRDYDPVACALPGMFLGDLALTGSVPEECDRLWELGARRVRLSGVVDLADTGTPDAAARTVRTLSLVRDLTARAVLVEWDLRPDPGRGPTAAEDISRLLSHLQPPQRIEGEGVDESAAADALRTWRNGHYLGKCLWRQGPGFVQIRDRRWGDLRRFTVDEPHYQEAIERLAYGAPAESVPADALADFREERLVLAVGGLEWWLPYRVNRWIQEAMTI